MAFLKVFLVTLALTPSAAFRCGSGRTASNFRRPEAVAAFRAKRLLLSSVSGADDFDDGDATKRRRKRKNAESSMPVAPEEVISFDDVLAADSVTKTLDADSLLGDIAEFRRKESASDRLLNAGDDKAQLRQVVGVLGTVLSYNFIVIIGFFLWFITGCVGQFAFKNDLVINAFTGLWENLILPLLSTHMALTFLSAGIEKFGGLKEA